MTFIYNFGIRLYYVLVLIVSLFNHKAQLWISGRKGCLKRIQDKIEPNSDYAWFHVSSLGEFEQGLPIMEGLKTQYPDIKIILTFFSPSGYEVKKDYAGADIISYLPLDTKRNAKRFVEMVNPKLTIFIKYEYWFHFLKQVSKSDSKLYLVSGIFRRKQLFFKSYGRWYRKMLSWFDYLFVQNKESLNLLESIGITNVEVTGDTRFDRVVQIARNSKQIEIAEVFARNSKVIVCGSTWEPDENLLIEYFQNTKHDIKLIIAPHEIKSEKIDSIAAKLKMKTVRFSKCKTEDLPDAKVLIIDNIGMLSSLYKYGQIAYIGGGFGAGIHNTLEAAAYGVPVIFGPNYLKFHEAVSLIDEKGAFSISNSVSLKTILDKLLSNDRYLQESGKAAKNYVKAQTGATKRIIEFRAK
jgi:3-deoxy-D-manno-octulosonic-acid transferase